MPKGLTTLGPKVKTSHGWCIATLWYIILHLVMFGYVLLGLISFGLVRVVLVRLGLVTLAFVRVRLFGLS
jgi:hypothetical protein